MTQNQIVQQSRDQDQCQVQNLMIIPLFFLYLDKKLLQKLLHVGNYYLKIAMKFSLTYFIDTHAQQQNTNAANQQKSKHNKSEATWSWRMAARRADAIT